MDLTTRQKRAVAELKRNPGHEVLVEVVFKHYLTEAMAFLRRAEGQQEVYEAALELRALERIKRDFEKLPTELEAELIEEGDTLYG